MTFSVARDTTALLDREAERLGVSVSEVIRRMIERVYGGHPKTKRRLAFASLGRSGRGDTSRTVDEILAREWGTERRGRAGEPPKRSRRTRGR
ncbi:MAG: ribbon-helix-helix protein, CopG family [Deltaproteobacteria bacterium]|nr:ribbon-helix-helix protein, CopG family [Deltaproteobacteria bacterium]